MGFARTGRDAAAPQAIGRTARVSGWQTRHKRNWPQINADNADQRNLFFCVFCVFCVNLRQNFLSLFVPPAYAGGSAIEPILATSV